MKVLEEIPNYSLEAFVAVDDQQCRVDVPHVEAAITIKVDSPELRCMKGDCNQDYSPG